MTDDRSAYIFLNMVQGIGPVTIRAIAGGLGSLGRVFDASRSDLMRVRGIGDELAGRILEQRGKLSADAEIERASRLGIRIMTQSDEGYPKRLRELTDAPVALYVMGEFKEGDERNVAVVGTRRASTYGRDCAERLAYQLVQAGFVVTSGLARGIDTAAHAGALKAGGRTLAFIGSGLDCIYPEENLDLAQRIAQHGAVVSEFPLGRKPDKASFPIRNRIVSGISMGVIVVEADRKSGAMITATQAAEQGRLVFAVPGRVDSPGSRGPHSLIRDGARLVENVEDILEEFENLLPSGAGAGGLARARQARTDGEGDEAAQLSVLTGLRFSPEETRLTNLLKDGARDMDSLVRESGLEPRKVSSLLVELEMKKVVRVLPGRMIELRRMRE